MTTIVVTKFSYSGNCSGNAALTHTGLRSTARGDDVVESGRSGDGPDPRPGPGWWLMGVAHSIVDRVDRGIGAGLERWVRGHHHRRLCRLGHSAVFEAAPGAGLWADT